MRRIIDELKRNGYNATEKKVFKNGVERNALLVDINGNISATFYEEQLKDMTVGDIISAVKNNKPCDMNVDEVFSAENVMKNIRIGLQRRSDEKIVKRDFHGYDKYLYLIVNIDNADGMSTTKITHDIISRIGMHLDVVWKVAEDNTYNEMEINDFIMIKYATNKSKVKGAGVIATKRGIADVRNALGSKKVLVIPSSIHEVIIMPYDNTIDLDDIRKMIREVNETQVAENDILGYEPIIL